jgi:hypothetical protein
VVGCPPAWFCFGYGMFHFFLYPFRIKCL